MTKDKFFNMLFGTGRTLCFFYIVGLAGTSDATDVPFGELCFRAICAAAVFIFLSILNRRKEDVVG